MLLIRRAKLCWTESTPAYVRLSYAASPVFSDKRDEFYTTLDFLLCLPSEYLRW